MIDHLGLHFFSPKFISFILVKELYPYFQDFAFPVQLDAFEALKIYQPCSYPSRATSFILEIH